MLNSAFLYFISAGSFLKILFCQETCKQYIGQDFTVCSGNWSSYDKCSVKSDVRNNSVCTKDFKIAAINITPFADIISCKLLLSSRKNVNVVNHVSKGARLLYWMLYRILEKPETLKLTLTPFNTAGRQLI